MSNVIKLFNGDPDCVRVFDALVEVLYDRGKDLPIPHVLGILDLVKQEVIDNAKNDQ